METVPLELRGTFVNGVPVSTSRAIAEEETAKFNRIAKRMRIIGMTAWAVPFVLFISTVVLALNSNLENPTIPVLFFVATVFSPILVFTIGISHLAQAKGLVALADDELLVSYQFPEEEDIEEEEVKEDEFTESNLPVPYEIGWPSTHFFEVYGNPFRCSSKATISLRPPVAPSVYTASVFAEIPAHGDPIQKRELSESEKSELRPLRREVFVSLWKGSLWRLALLWLSLGATLGSSQVNWLGALALGLLFFAFCFRERLNMRFIYGLTRDLQTGIAVVCKTDDGTPMEFLPESGILWTINVEPASWRFVPFSPSA